MKLACSTLHYDFAKSWTLVDALDDIADAGFSGVEITLAGSFHCSELQTGSPARERLAARGLEVVSLGTSLFWAGEERVLERNRAAMEEIVDLAHELGVPHIGVVTGPWPDGIERAVAETQIVDNLRWAVERAGRVEIALETIGVKWPDSHWLAHDLASFRATRARVGDGLRARIDVSNYLAGGDDPATVVEHLGQLIAGVHFKDALSNDGRCVPAGEGDADFSAVVAALQRVGYDGWVVVEDESWTSGHGHDPAKQSRAALAYYATVQGLSAR
jgi:sugar phosphate isomerase/epimerase